MSEIHLCSVCAKAPAVVTVLKCDFCGRDQGQVKKLVHGSYGADICDECAAVAHETAAEAIARTALASTSGDGS